MPNYKIYPEQAASRTYREALSAELLAHYEESELSVCPLNHREVTSYKGRVLGAKLPVSDYADWTLPIIEEFGPREKCLSLGSGIGRVERYMINNGFTESFDSIELNPEHVRMTIDRDDRVGAIVGDLNFVDLPENHYDFILCHGILHHLINLEHVLEEVNRALKPGGICLIYEYVGPTRWQFPDEHLAYLKTHFPDLMIMNPHPWSVDGFESVRSGDLLGLINKMWSGSEIRSSSFGAAYFPIITCAPWSDVEPRMSDVIAVDEQLSQSNQFLPCYHMGLYAKSENTLPEVGVWTAEDLAAHFPTPPTVGSRVQLRIARMRRRFRVRTRLKSLFRIA